MRILWSPQSLRDLDAIREYIAKDSEHYAGLTIARIFSAVEQLIGRVAHPMLTLSLSNGLGLH